MLSENDTSDDWADNFREDCDPQCRGYRRYDENGRRTECCGGCPAQCYCRLESEADAAASRLSGGYEYDYPDDDYGYGDAETEFGDGEGA